MGLFSRKTFADAIYENAKIITLDLEYPNAGAVAVKDGKILRVGEFEDVEDLVGKDTERYDLCGRYLCPGFIKIQDAPADTVFADFFEAVSEDLEAEEMHQAISEYMLNKDSEASLASFFALSYEYAKKGFTSICGVNANNIIVNMYMEMLTDVFSADLIKQRYYGFNTLKSRPDPRLVVRMMDAVKLNCLELGGLVNFAGICPIVDEENFSEDYLKALLDTVCDKGYDVRVFAKGKGPALKSYDVLGNLSSAYKNSAFMLCTDEVFTDEELAEVYTGDVVLKPYKPVDGDFQGITINAAGEIGMNALGSIEEGKAADFAVFDKNPEEAYKDGPAGDSEAYMTILSGRPIYGPGLGNASDWQQSMLGEMAEFSEELGNFIEPDPEEE